MINSPKPKHKKRRLKITRTKPINHHKTRKTSLVSSFLKPALIGAGAGAIPALYKKIGYKNQSKYARRTLVAQRQLLSLLKEDDQFLFDIKLEL